MGGLSFGGFGVSLRSFLDLFRRRPQPDAARETYARDHSEDALGIEPLRILISPLAGDLQGLAARHIRDRLSGRSGVVISVADRPLTAPGADHSEALFVSMAVDLGRRWLKRENADLLVWGESVPARISNGPGRASWRLRFLSLSTPIHPQSASFSALERLEVPALFDDATGNLVFGAALAAVNVERAEGDMAGTVAECATAQACYAALLLLEGARMGDERMLQRAVAVYQGALILGEDAFPLHERAMIGSHIADALSLIGEFGAHARHSDKTLEYYRAALGMVRKEVFADEYAALHTRLGVALHARAQASAETIHLKEAADAFTAATHIWTITEAPERWADIQNSLGGLLITMGRLTQQPPLFDKAVAVFTKIAQARSRAKAPAVWAATLANIGAALKEKGAAAKDVAYLQQALEAFDQAVQVFTELDLESSAKIAEMQRGHVLTLLAAYRT
jgi:tetratricopeptide (TPR) repeat protein